MLFTAYFQYCVTRYKTTLPYCAVDCRFSLLRDHPRWSWLQHNRNSLRHAARVLGRHWRDASHRVSHQHTFYNAVILSSFSLCQWWRLYTNLRILLRKSLTYFLTTVVRLSTMQCHPFVSRQRWCRSNNFVIQLNTQFCRNTDTFADINSLMSLHATRQGTLDYSRLSSRSHCGMILAYKVEIGVHELISALKKKKKK